MTSGLCPTREQPDTPESIEPSWGVGGRENPPKKSPSWDQENMPVFWDWNWAAFQFDLRDCTPGHEVCADLRVHDLDLDGKCSSVTHSSQTNITLVVWYKGGGREKPVFKIWNGWHMLQGHLVWVCLTVPLAPRNLWGTALARFSLF